MNIYKMAWRNVWRNKRRSSVTIGAMTLALFSMVQYSGLYEGYLNGMERSILELEMGDIQFHAKGYRDNPSIYLTIDEHDILVEKIEASGKDVKASARLMGSGLAAAGDASAGVSIKGIDVLRDSKVSKIGQHVEVGSWLKTAKPNHVVIGKRLAHTLGVKPGDEIVILSQAADGSMANELYNVCGILKNISAGVDRAGIFMNSNSFRELMGMPDGVHQIVIRSPKSKDVNVDAKALSKLDNKVEVKSWKQLNPTLSLMLQNSESSMFVMFLIIYTAIGILVLNTMLMAVFERIREFGVLKAIGLSPFKVMNLIFIESTIQTSIAILIGGAVSIPVGYYFVTHGIDMGALGGFAIQGVAMESVWRASFNAKAIITPVVALIYIVSLSVVYPAIKAAVIKPVSAIHHS